jgi:large subunit ribosomal protein L31
MKAKIHPNYNTASVTTCVCGATFSYGSVNNETKVEICSNCHPFYTGLEKTLDTTGRVDRFKKRMAKATV